MAALGSRWIPNVHTRSDAVSGGVFELLRIKLLRNTLIASGIVSTAWDVYQFFMPIYGRAQGLSATAIGAVLSAFAVAIILVRLVLPLAVRHTGEAQMLTYSHRSVAQLAFCPVSGSSRRLGARGRRPFGLDGCSGAVVSRHRRRSFNNASMRGARKKVKGGRGLPAEPGDISRYRPPGAPAWLPGSPRCSSRTRVALAVGEASACSHAKFRWHDFIETQRSRKRSTSLTQYADPTVRLSSLKS